MNAAPFDRITSTSNPRLKLIHQLLTQAAARKKKRLTVVESPKIIAEINTHSPESIEFGIYRDDLEDVPYPRFFSVESAIFKGLTSVATSQGILAVIRTPVMADTLSIIPCWAIGLDGVSDPRNLGAILRSSKAFGCPLVMIGPDCADPFHPEVMRIAATNILTLPLVRLTETTYDRAIKEGMVPMVMDMNGDEISPEYQFPSHPLFIFGSEGGGIRSPWILNRSHIIGRIPITDQTESLNVSVAAGILQYMFNYRSIREG